MSLEVRQAMPLRVTRNRIVHAIRGHKGLDPVLFLALSKVVNLKPAFLLLDFEEEDSLILLQNHLQRNNVGVGINR